MIKKRIQRQVFKPDTNSHRASHTKLPVPEASDGGSSSSDIGISESYGYDLPSGRPPSESSKECDAHCWLQERSNTVESISALSVTNLRRDSLSTAASVSSLIYSALKPWQTRLVVLDPGQDDESLSCSLIVTDIIDGHGFAVTGTSQVVGYEALSYSWGHKSRNHYIRCNGHSLGVPEQLALALLYLRSASEKRYLWCDAICMNQEDLTEKAVQVRSMFRIFEKADRVIAWLGTPHSLCDQTIQTLHAASDPDLRRLWFWRGHTKACSRVAKQVRTVLADLMARPWFQRTWVRQEVYAAKDLQLQIGRHLVEFREFLYKVQHIDKLFSLMSFKEPQIKKAATLAIYVAEYQHAGADRKAYNRGELLSYTSYWLRTLLDGTHFQVTDERDRIYATLGILTNRNVRFVSNAPADIESLTKNFPIDYNKYLYTVYQDVTKFLINTLKSLEILEFFQPQYFHNHLDDPSPTVLPSWCKNWAEPATHVGYSQPISHERNKYRDILEQDYNETGLLRLEGITAVRRLTILDARKEIAHPRDRFNPKFRRSITFSNIIQEPQGRSLSYLYGRPVKFDHPPFAFVFSYMEETDSAYEFRNEIVNASEFDPDFASHLASDNFCFGYAEDFLDDDSLGLEDLSFVLPYTAMLGDVLVSLYGSRCLHLVRPLGGSTDGTFKCRLIGPAVGLVCGQEHINKYSSRSQLGSKLIPKDNPRASESKRRRKEFLLI